MPALVPDNSHKLITVIGGSGFAGRHIVRALAKVKRIEEGGRRSELERRLERLQAKLRRLTPKRGASIVGIDELNSLVRKYVTNRAQAEKLMQAVRRLCE